MRSSGVRSCSRTPRSSCEDAKPPPCPPCARPAPPPCRAATPRCRPALRVKCCPPRPGPPPPPCTPLQPLTCENARPLSKNTRKPTDCLSTSSPCGAELDQVAQRLAAAEAARRAEYECEAAARAAAPAPRPPRATYRLSAEQECVRATDGCNYTVSSNKPPQHRPPPQGSPGCGPNREPPPPEPVELLPTDACEIRHKRYVDPCAHRPRIILEVDRTPVDAASKAPQEKPVAAASADCPKRLTTRIMESLNLKRERKSCQRSSCEGRDADKDRPGWCADPPKPVNVPTRCREPTIVEQLRQRPGGTGGHHCNTPGKQLRKLHTSIIFMNPTKNTSSGGCPPTKNPSPDQLAKDQKKCQGQGLEAVLRERAQHKEVALGRVVSPQGAARAPAGPGAGRLELRIPPASEAVRVKVNLDFVPKQNVSCLTPEVVARVTESCNPAPAQHAASRTLCSGNDKSWLSIRGIQKKWSGYCKKEGAGAKNANSKSPVRPKCPSGADGEAQRRSTPDICGSQSKPPTNICGSQTQSPPNICNPKSASGRNICSPQSKPTQDICGPQKSSESSKASPKPKDNEPRCGPPSSPGGGDTRQCASALALLQTVY